MQKRYELVYLITSGRNYSGSSKVTVSSIINHGRPADGRMPSIVGGLMYRGSADPLLKGRYRDDKHITLLCNWFVQGTLYSHV